MSTKQLYTRHSRALATLYSELEDYTVQQPTVFTGTAGTVNQRKNAKGFEFYAHQYYDGSGKQREKYLAGPVGSEEADSAADDLRSRIREVKELVPSLRMLGREGFNLVDSRTYAIMAALFNHEVFEAGGILVGSHAYGVLLNRLGVRARPYATEDVDIARPSALAFEQAPDESLLEMLTETGIDFVPVPSLKRKEPPTSYKQKGRSRFHLDLLVPSPDESYPIVPVPELKAHATGLPYLSYLLAESQTAMLMAREGCCSVRVPLQERFAVHKLIVSQLRTENPIKSEKDVHQACVLCAALAETHPGAIESAVDAIPKRARKHFKKALRVATATLKESSPRAWDELTG